VTIQPISQPMSPLRRRMLEDMAMRGLREDTQRDYIRFVRSFATFLRRPPDTATPEDIRRFQVHQVESGVQPQSINCSVSALRFFFTVTLDRPDLARQFRQHARAPRRALRGYIRRSARTGLRTKPPVGSSRHPWFVITAAAWAKRSVQDGWLWRRPRAVPQDVQHQARRCISPSEGPMRRSQR
jgi:Phage integrase, N-terminal SAM-like domain